MAERQRTTRPSVGGQTPALGNCQKKSLYLALFEMRYNPLDLRHPSALAPLPPANSPSHSPSMVPHLGVLIQTQLPNHIRQLRHSTRFIVDRWT